MTTLQVNTNGAWKSVASFDAARREDVIAGLSGLAQQLGESVTWCLLHDDGKREWLRDIHADGFPGWDNVTPTSPAPLLDVLVSAWDESDRECQVYMAWRSATDPDRWMLSGSDEVLPFQVYAWGPVMAAAPRSAFVAQEEAA